ERQRERQCDGRTEERSAKRRPAEADPDFEVLGKDPRRVRQQACDAEAGASRRGEDYGPPPAIFGRWRRHVSILERLRCNRRQPFAGILSNSAWILARFSSLKGPGSYCWTAFRVRSRPMVWNISLAKTVGISRL